MTPNLTNRTIALAALVQSIECLRQIAWQGRIEAEPLRIMINSLFADDVNSIEEIYGGLGNLHNGLRILTEHEHIQHQDRNIEIMRYAISLMALERKLSKQPDMVSKVQKGLEDAQKQAEYFDSNITHESVIANLADLYKNTISEIGPKIMVQGNQTYLGNTDNTNKIRALLLCGIRAALLWHQAKGGRIKLLLGRGKMAAEAKRLINVTD